MLCQLYGVMSTLWCGLHTILFSHLKDVKNGMLEKNITLISLVRVLHVLVLLTKPWLTRDDLELILNVMSVLLTLKTVTNDLERFTVCERMNQRKFVYLQSWTIKICKTLCDEAVGWSWCAAHKFKCHCCCCRCCCCRRRRRCRCFWESQNCMTIIQS